MTALLSIFAIGHISAKKSVQELANPAGSRDTSCPSMRNCRLSLSGEWGKAENHDEALSCAYVEGQDANLGTQIIERPADIDDRIFRCTGTIVFEEVVPSQRFKSTRAIEWTNGWSSRVLVRPYGKGHCSRLIAL